MPLKHILFSVFISATAFLFVQCQKKTEVQYSFLALGDSYTIGEGVPDHKNFPTQTIDLLKKNGYDFKSPRIIARTGWTTGQLQQAINTSSLSPDYTIVTLLIGVNNQYRGYDIDEYALQFEKLLQQAISFAGNDTMHVFVLSIPDWSVTPFADGSNKEKITQEIDQYNQINKKITLHYNVTYVDITADYQAGRP